MSAWVITVTFLLYFSCCLEHLFLFLNFQIQKKMMIIICCVLLAVVVAFIIGGVLA